MHMRDVSKRNKSCQPYVDQSAEQQWPTGNIQVMTWKSHRQVIAFLLEALLATQQSRQGRRNDRWSQWNTRCLLGNRCILST
eukprot:6490537-Amphidinium_carterae.3